MHLQTVKSVWLQNTWNVAEDREAKLAENDLLGLECQVKGVWSVVPNLTKFYNHDEKNVKIRISSVSLQVTE